MVDERDRDPGDPPGHGDTVRDGHAPTLVTPSGGIAVPVAAGTSPDASPTLPLGSRARSSPAADLDGSRYRLGELVGQGGMGEVLLAFDEQVGREVAVKRIRSDHPTAEDVARFLREARVQGRLDHPAVVPVHDIAVDRAGKPFFVMRRLAGTEMKDLLTLLRMGAEPDEAAARRRLLRAFVDVCLAVEFAHRRGIVHRDLKPANIMLGDFGEVYVLDWGIARSLPRPANVAPGDTPGARMLADPEEEVTRAGTVLGTPAYMAPEQLAGEPAGTAADIYALGCMLYEIAAGEPLHALPRSMANAFAAPEARPSLRRADSPPELDAICARATAIDPAARFESARALGGAVQAYLDGDRDVAARKELARHHLAQARAARSRGDTDADRRIAMREAGRALALDPTANEAADLVTHLMLAPAGPIPDEVQRQLEANDIATGRSQGRIGAIAMTGYLGFVPLLMWTGVRDPAIVAAFAAVAMLSAGQVYAMTRSDKISQAGIYLSACINAVLIGLVCRLVGPFIIAPTLVLTTLMAYAVHPMFGRMKVVAGILTLGVAVPWLLEVAGVVEPTYHFEAGAIVLASPAIRFSAAPVQLAFAVLLVLLVAVVAILLRTMATRQREVTQQIELQAWHLRQLVPTSAP